MLTPLSPTSPPTASARLRTAAAPGCELAQPADVAELSLPAAPTRVKPEAPARKKSLVRRLARVAGWTGVATSAAAGVVGGLAYHTNRAALQAHPTVRVLTQTAEQRVPESAPLAQQLAPVRAEAAPVKLFIPASTVANLAGDLQRDAELEAMLQARAQAAQQSLQARLNELKIPDGTVLLDVTMPLPTSERSALQLGSVDLPAFGLHALQTESVPLALEYATQPVTTGLTVEVHTTDARPEKPGPGLLLGAIRVRLSAADEGAEVRGSVKLRTDLDGSATRAGKLSEADRAARLRQGERLRRVGDLLEKGFGNQQAEFTARVKPGEGPLAETTLFVWATPDRGGDGRADLAVTQEADLAPLRELQVELTQLHSTGQAPEGLLASALHEKIAASLTSGLHGAVPQLTAQLRQLAEGRTQREFGKGAETLQAHANRLLEQAYGKELKVPQASLGVGQVEASSQGLLVAFHTPGGAGDAELAPDLQLRPGQAAAAVDRGELNRFLREKVDWHSMLEKARVSGGLHELSFGDVPQLEVHDGRLALVFDLTAKLPGAKPTEGATGLVKGATGLLDSGAGEVQGALEKNVGVLGSVLGGIIRAPFFVVDKVAEGGKAVLDNTVGKVVDAVPEVATRPTIHTRVIVPLELAAEDGALAVRPDAAAVEFAKARSELPFDLLDLLPTRLLSNAIVNLVADAQGPAAVGQKVEGKGLSLDVQGARVEDVRTGPGGDVTVILGTGPQTAQRLSQLLGY